MSSPIRKPRGDRDYVTRKPGRKWAVRFQYPEALRQSAMDLWGRDSWPTERQISLDTHDELEARRRALPEIAMHLELIAFHHARNSDTPMASIEYVQEMAPDAKLFLPDGTKIYATANTIFTIHPDGTPEDRPNKVRPILRYTEIGMAHPAVKDAAAARKELEAARQPTQILL